MKNHPTRFRLPFYVFILVILLLNGIIVCWWYHKHLPTTFITGLELPRPIIDFSAINAKSVNDYSLMSMRSPSHSSEKKRENRPSMTFIVRAYSGNIAGDSQLTRLVKGIIQNCRSPSTTSSSTRECDIDVSIIVVSMDKASIPLLEHAIESIQALLNSMSPSLLSIDIHQHVIPSTVYDDNCCQVFEMCSSDRYSAEWDVSFKRVYGHYKNQRAKKRSICEYNNLLQYTLTDAVMQYVLLQCNEDKDSIIGDGSSSTDAGSNGGTGGSTRDGCDCNNRYVVLTNADNEYDPSFLSAISSYFHSHTQTDAIILNYIENKHYRSVGSKKVDAQITLNHIDLGAMVFRLSSLKLLHASILASMPLKAWPHDWYAADAVFLMSLQRRGLKVGKMEERLFTHW